MTQFDAICDDTLDQPGYWISKVWLKGTHCVVQWLCNALLILYTDWRLQKPKMHTPLQGDAPPDAPEYLGHVVCAHGQLSLVSTARRSISTKVSSIHLHRRLVANAVTRLATLSKACSLIGYHARLRRSTVLFVRQP